MIELNLKKSPELEKAKVWKSELWRHADEKLKRDEAVERADRHARERLIRAANKEKLRLAPFIGIGCPGLIEEDGSIERGAQNLPGNWSGKDFNLPHEIREAIPRIGDDETAILIHNDAVIQGLSEVPFMTDIKHWGVLTIGTGLGNARFTNRQLKNEPRGHFWKRAAWNLAHRSISGSLPSQATCGRFANAIVDKLTYALGTNPEAASKQDWYTATALAVRDRVVDIWMRSSQHDRAAAEKAGVLSLDRIPARKATVRRPGQSRASPAGARSLGLVRAWISTICEAASPILALATAASGGLPLAISTACRRWAFPPSATAFATSKACSSSDFITAGRRSIPTSGWRTETPGNFRGPNQTFPIHFGGTVEYSGGDEETAPAIWHPAETVLATAYDIAIAGWRGRHANTLRLWCARQTHPSQFDRLTSPQCRGPAHSRRKRFPRALIPTTARPRARSCRLRQEYFFTSASLQDLVQRHLSEHDTLESLPNYAAIQLNDTHPAIAVAELMRILIDEHDYSWKQAWTITRSTLSYTNHTLLPEALESWPVSLLGQLLPRHLQIIYLINWLHLQSARRARFCRPGFHLAHLADPRG